MQVKTAFIDNILQAIDDGDTSKKKLSKLLQKTPMDAASLCELVRIVRDEENRHRQQQAANIRHSQTKVDKAFVLEYWDTSRNQFTTNIGFSRAAVEKFKLSVKAETIARDWLKNFTTPHCLARQNNAIAYVNGRFFDKKATMQLK
jgi:hypothetical protein